MRIVKYLLTGIGYIFYFSIPILCFAQWVPEGLPVYQNIYVAGYDICPDGNSGVIVAWDHHDGEDLDIMAQHVDSAGYLKWGDQGIIIYEDDIYSHGNIITTADGEQGAFISWVDTRNTDTSGTDIYAQHIDEDGNLLWPLEGIRVFVKPTSQNYQSVVLDRQGGIIVVCHDSHNGKHIIAQRLNPEGRRVWSDTGIYIYNQESNWLAYPEVIKSGEDFICVWNPLDYGDPNERDIYAQKFDINGNILWQVNGIPVVSYLEEQGGYSAVSDGAGGVVVAWIDNRHYPPYRNAVYADRLDNTGQSVWQENGMLIGYGGAGDTRPKRVYAFNHNYSFAIFWRYYASAILFTQYVYPNSMIRWPEGGRLVHEIGFPTEFTSSGGDDFEYIAGIENGRFIGIKTNVDCEDLWPNRPCIATYIFFEYLDVISDDVGGLIACWRVRSGQHIRVNRIYPDGRLGGDTTTVILDTEKKIPDKITLYQNYPNPFNSETNIVVNVKGEEKDCSMFIYDSGGRLVRQLISNITLTGENIFKWKGDDNDGLPVASGVYFCVLESNSFSKTIVLNLIK